jgi:putative transposase
MGRKKVEQSKIHPYHIMQRTFGKSWFGIDMNTMWSISKYSLSKANLKYPVIIHAFVLMRNHYHLVVSTPNEDISSFMFEFNRNIGILIKRVTKVSGPKFKGRYKGILIRNKSYYQNVIRYVFQNPLSAGIVNFCEDYEFSTLYYEVHRKEFATPLKKLTFKKLGWLNQFVGGLDRKVSGLF